MMKRYVAFVGRIAWNNGNGADEAVGWEHILTESDQQNPEARRTGESPAISFVTIDQALEMIEQYIKAQDDPRISVGAPRYNYMVQVVDLHDGRLVIKKHSRADDRRSNS
jgi:hypothetical protein